MNSPPDSGKKDPSPLAPGEIAEESVEENVRRIVKGMRASSCMILAKNMREDKEALARIIKGLGTGAYTRDLKSAQSKTERKHFLINEIELLKGIDSAETEQQKIQYFKLLIRRLVENQCHCLARNLVEAILARSSSIHEDTKSKALGAILPPVKKPRSSVLDAVNKVLGPVFGAKPKIESAPIFPDDESDVPERKSAIPPLPPKKK